MMAKILVFVFFVTLLLASASGASKRPCEPCPNSEYPVCATNGTHWFLFRNACRLDAENEKRERNGDTCLKQTEIANCFQKCDQVCTKEYAPICATWGENTYTFLNRCELDLENCKVGNIWSILHEGECSQVQSSTAQPPPTTPPPTAPPTAPPTPPSTPPPTPPPTPSPTPSPSTTPCPPPSMPTSRPPPPRPKPTEEPQPLPPTTESPQDECPEFCTTEYAPVCATTGDKEQTFTNLCFFQVEACTSRQNWQLKGHGECNESAPICNEACPKIYSPICATFNGENKSFDNECILDLENCKTGNQWDIVHKGECQEPIDDCPSACPEIYEPLCAVNPDGERRTFPNLCFLNMEYCKTNQEWEIVSIGECPTPPQRPPPPEQCPQACPRIYQPVCAATNGVQQTFSNLCLLDVEICTTGVAWEIINEGKCAPPTPPTSSAPPTQMTTPSRPPCPDVCPAVYDPVCASSMGDIRTFSNGCELSVESCKTGRTWKVLFRGRCEDQYGADMQDGGTSICPAIYDPICAAFRGETRTFSNKCQMDAEISRTSTPWEIVATGECEKLPPELQPSGPCPKCSNYYQPVCGFQNGEQKTFTNECHMLAENCYGNTKWVVVYEGECKVSDQPRNCPNICPLTYEPVCAEYNGVRRTFQNECELNHESYRTGAEWIIVSGGECDFCPMCPDENDPICAELNGEIRTFDSTCKMEYENCKTGSGWRVIYKNACTNQVCPGFCPNVYEPVCASNNSAGSRTFSNECEMKMESCHTDTDWTLQFMGECPSVKENCPKKCKTDFNPVCATNQRVTQSFVNECLLKSTNCNSGSDDWVVVHYGQCANNEPESPPRPIQLNQPNQPMQQMQPIQEIQPNQQMQPNKPLQPNKPFQPSQDVQPTQSGQQKPPIQQNPSLQSNQQIQPIQGAQPSIQPNQPRQPNQSAQPNQPLQSANADQPNQQNQSFQPNQPSQPSPPNYGSQPTQSAQINQPPQQNEPYQPYLPNQPSPPFQPNQPTQPNQKVPPNPPAKPHQPMQPNQPNQPPVQNEGAQPNQPYQPNKPYQPSQPNQPNQPTLPNQGAQPNKPYQPNQPSLPSQPSQPIQPNKPFLPTQPAQPNQPLQRYPSSQPPPPSSPIHQTQSIQIAGTLQASQAIEVSPIDAQTIYQLLNRLPPDSRVSYGPPPATQPDPSQPGYLPSPNQSPVNQLISTQQPPSQSPPSKQVPSQPHRCRIVPCLAVYDPVCGTFNGVERTFSNLCSLSNFNCRYHENWKILHDGLCEKSIETQYDR